MFIDSYLSVISKNGQTVSGDVSGVFRYPEYTLAIVCDGIGSGIKANIAAEMCITRIKELAYGGLSLRKIFRKVSDDMEQAKTSESFYCAMCAVMFFPDGKTTAAFYDFPVPCILRDSGKWEGLAYDKIGKFCESNFVIRENELICIVSDGITQAGMGVDGASALGAEGVLKHLNGILYKTPAAGIPKSLTLKAKEISGGLDDDTTALVLCPRKANVLTVLSGPPLLRESDALIINKFLAQEGKKAICGSTTMDIFCRVTGKKAGIDPAYYTDFIPPEYEIEGIDLASEGAITLNQCYNLLKEKTLLENAATSPAKLANLMLSADIVHFIEGMSENKGHGDIMFKQMGILPRKEIIDKIRKLLIQADKTVINEEV